MAHTFKVGDIVVANRHAEKEYRVTNGDMSMGKVMELFDDGLIRLLVVGHKNINEIGQTFVVHSRFFVPIMRAMAVVRDVHYSPPATVVFWSDGTKTVAKCAPYERFDREKGLAIACAKKLLGEGYADAFKEFREPQNRVLSIDEVHALRDGTKLYVEIKSSVFSGEGVHWKSGSKLIAQNGCFWPIDKASEDVGRTAKWARVWLLPRKPTADELRANPWPKREG